MIQQQFNLHVVYNWLLIRGHHIDPILEGKPEVAEVFVNRIREARRRERDQQVSSFFLFIFFNLLSI